MSQGVSQALEALALVVSGNQNQLGRLAGKDALKRRAEFLKRVMNGRNNHGDILAGEGRLAWDGLGLV